MGALSKQDVGVADQLFATLDPTLRAARLPKGGTAILSDTVGFISDLPVQLVDAFRVRGREGGCVGWCCAGLCVLQGLFAGARGGRTARACPCAPVTTQLRPTKATLEEVVEADLLLHVLDASSPHVLEQRRVVLEVCALSLPSCLPACMPAEAACASLLACLGRVHCPHTKPPTHYPNAMRRSFGSWA